MADREKVIKGLELCLKGDSNLCEISCPYYYQCGAFYENNEALLKDALSMLKAQEPRVFDADEIVLSAEPSGWLWLEMENGHCGEAYKAGRTISGFINFGHGFDSLFTSLFPEDYGKTWRCRTSRPTDEQRAATPWPEPPKEET